MFATIIFVTGLLSFMTNTGSGNIETTKKNKEATDFVFKASSEIEPYTSTYTLKSIESYIGSTINLGVLFGKEILTGKTVAIGADFTISGLVGAHKWAPQNVSVIPTSNPNHFNYRVKGILKWTILGMPVFSQTKTLEGVIAVK